MTNSTFPRRPLPLPLRFGPLQQIVGAGTAQVRSAILHHHLAVDITGLIRNQKTGEIGKFSVSGLAAGRYYAIAVAREGFRPVANPGEAFFELLSREATPFVIGDDERRTLELRLWRWPE